MLPNPYQYSEEKYKEKSVSLHNSEEGREKEIGVLISSSNNNPVRFIIQPSRHYFYQLEQQALIHLKHIISKNKNTSRFLYLLCSIWKCLISGADEIKEDWIRSKFFIPFFLCVHFADATNINKHNMKDVRFSIELVDLLCSRTSFYNFYPRKIRNIQETITTLVKMLKIIKFYLLIYYYHHYCIISREIEIKTQLVTIRELTLTSLLIQNSI